MSGRRSSRLKKDPVHSEKNSPVIESKKRSLSKPDQSSAKKHAQEKQNKPKAAPLHHAYVEEKRSNPRVAEGTVTMRKVVAEIKKKNAKVRPKKHSYYQKAINKFLSTGIVPACPSMSGLYPKQRALFKDGFFSAALEWYFYTNKQQDGITPISWGQMKNFRGYLGSTLAMKNKT